MVFRGLLGYSYSRVLGWLHSEFLPEESEILSIAVTLRTEVFSTLGHPAMDPELLKIYHSFSHLHGEFRSRLAQALWEAEKEKEQKKILSNFEEAKAILNDAFIRWRLMQ